MVNERNEDVIEMLNHQLPTYFRPIIEFQEIMKAHGFALGELKKTLMRIWDNCYLISCDSQTLAWYESLLGITKTKGLTLEERRVAVLMQYSMRFLYTLPALKEMLALAVGTDKYSVECLYERYQMIVRIIDQDISLVKEMYNMIALMKPAHIVLFLYAEYRESAKLEVKQAISITLTTEFYPRFNLPRLRLNRAWKLNGSRKLSGYDGFDRIDLYPVQMEMQISVIAKPREETGITFLSGAQEKMESVQEVEVMVSAECSEMTEEKISLQTSAQVYARAGDVRVTNLNFLDSKWKLNGKRKLNGGIDVR